MKTPETSPHLLNIETMGRKKIETVQRFLKLAESRARYSHLHEHGHQNNFESCPQPDCASVRHIKDALTWKPIETAPRDRWLFLKGESGYINRPCRVHVGRWEGDHRPLDPWQTTEGTSFEDDGGPPHYWAELF